MVIRIYPEFPPSPFSKSPHGALRDATHLDRVGTDEPTQTVPERYIRTATAPHPIQQIIGISSSNPGEVVSISRNIPTAHPGAVRTPLTVVPSSHRSPFFQAI